jgi:catechol 2,3-dioxygenase-like lactoylglutathione lyase family enzyme
MGSQSAHLGTPLPLGNAGAMRRVSADANGRRRFRMRLSAKYTCGRHWDFVQCTVASADDRGASVLKQMRGTNVIEEDPVAIFTHVTVGTNDLAKARSFYDSVLGALGYKRLNDLGDNGSIWGESAPEFFVLKPANGKPATIANGGTISFVAPSRAAVAAFHKAALAAGGLDEGAVGPRSWHPTAYAGYARDLDGNKIAAYCFKPE